MSASSKKKLRKEQESAKMTELQMSAQKEAKKLNLYTTIFVVVLALLLVVAVTVGVNQTITNSGIREKKTIALTVGDHEISNAELNYFYMDAINQFNSQYGSYAALMGLDPSKPLDEQVSDPETGLTWADDFLATAKENAKAVYAMADAAAAEGFALSEEDVTAIGQSVANMDLYAQLSGFSSGEEYLKAIYGKGASKESFLDYNELTALANAYSAKHVSEMTYEDADLRAVDSEKYEAYSSFTFHAYYLSANGFLTGGTTDEEGNTTYSAEEKAAAAQAAEAAALSLTTEEIASIADFDSAIAALEVNLDKDAASTEYSELLYTKLNSLYADWVADGTRKLGDKACFASTSTDAEGNEVVNGYYVVFFIDANDNNFKLANVRHILTAFSGGTKDEATGLTTYSDEEKAAAKTAAEELLAQWQEGEANEDSFAALANEKSDDGNGTTGGLYENVYPGQMVPAFNDWCFDNSRKAGDTGIVETQYGYHVMYYVGDSEYTYRDFMIENELRAADAKQWQEEVVSSVDVTEGDTRYIETSLVLARG